MFAASTALLPTIAADNASTNDDRAGRGGDGGYTSTIHVDISCPASNATSVVACTDAGGKRTKQFLDSVTSFDFQNFTPTVTRVRQQSTKYNADYDSFGYSGFRLGVRQGSSGSGTPPLPPPPAIT